MGHRGFWHALMAVLLALYGAAFVLILQGQGVQHVIVRLAGIVLAVHVLEIPLAFRALKERQPAALRVVVATLLFGAAWWLPARRGLLAVT